MSKAIDPIDVTIKAMNAARDLARLDTEKLPSRDELEEMVDRITQIQTSAIKVLNSKSSDSEAKVYSKPVYGEIAAIAEATYRLGVACGLLDQNSNPTTLAPGVYRTKSGHIKI